MKFNFLAAFGDGANLTWAAVTTALVDGEQDGYWYIKL